MKVGDKVIINKDRVIATNGELCKWYTDREFTIIEITNENDNKGEPIVLLDKNLIHVNKVLRNNSITSYYLDSIKEQRKQKLNKINESR